MDIVVKHSSDWTPLIATGAALGGALIGVTGGFLLEFWRQVLNGRSAARIIRMEIQHNMNICLLCISLHKPDITLTGKAWSEHMMELAPLLPDEVLLNLSTSYGASFLVQNQIAAIADRPEQAEREIKTWLEPLKRHAGLLKQIEARRRVAQFIDLLLGRATFPPKVADSKGDVASASVPKIEDLVETVRAKQAEESGKGQS